jgi:hypothetical protein
MLVLQEISNFICHLKRNPMLSLTQAIALLHQQFSGDISITAIDIDSGEKISHPAPAYVFRGESELNTELLSSRQRLLRNANLSQETKDEIQQLAEHIESFLRSENPHLGPMWAAGILQHYGFPTEIIDATSCIETAAAFAVSKNTSCNGQIFVYSVEQMLNNAIVIDLTPMDFSRRPVRQKGYAIFDRKYKDLRDPVPTANFGTKVLSFTISDFERQQYDRDAYIYETHGDPMLNMLGLILDQYYAGKKNQNSGVRNWLFQNLHWQQVPLNVVSARDGRPTTVELTTQVDPYITYQAWLQLRKSNSTQGN